MADFYADEGITGTKVAVRQGFQKMIRDCMDGQIDIILTKSVSRFSRNTVDTIQYVRMLKEKGIAVIFEKEGINTMTEQGEMFITLMSTLAQNEVESFYPQNVKMGIRMKLMKKTFTVEPYKVTFVMKGNGNTAIPNTKKNFKESAS